MHCYATTGEHTNYPRQYCYRQSIELLTLVVQGGMSIAEGAWLRRRVEISNYMHLLWENYMKSLLSTFIWQHILTRQVLNLNSFSI